MLMLSLSFKQLTTTIFDQEIWEHMQASVLFFIFYSSCQFGTVLILKACPQRVIHCSEPALTPTELVTFGI